MGQFKEGLVVFFLCYFKFKTFTFLGKIFKQDCGYFWSHICQKRGAFQITNFFFIILYAQLQGCYMTNRSSKVFSTLAGLTTAFSLSLLSRILEGFWEMCFLAAIFFNLPSETRPTGRLLVHFRIGSQGRIISQTVGIQTSESSVI